jgi:signal transduction histidine kinase
VVLTTVGAFISESEAADPLWPRLVLGGLFAIAFTGSFLARWSRKAFLRTMWGLFYLEIGWAAVIGAANGFEDGYGAALLLTYALTVGVVWIGAESIRPVVWTAGFGLGAALIAGAAGPVSVEKYVVIMVGLGTVGIVEGVLAMSHFQARSEIRERKEIERELRRAKKDAEEAARLKSAMLANMSHEIRTPVTPIKGFSEALAEELSGEERKLAERIQRSSERLVETVDSGLHLSELEAGATGFDREQVDLKALAREATKQFKPEAEEKGVSLTADLNGSVEGDWNGPALRRAAENLIENAVKFTPGGGRVTVRARTSSEEAILKVEDTGIGIEEEGQEQVFEPFRQESEGWSREYEGTGLGLSITERLAEAHGGSVELYSQKGEGSRFLVRLPRADATAGASAVDEE